MKIRLLSIVLLSPWVLCYTFACQPPSAPPRVVTPPTIAAETPLARAEARTESVASLGEAAKPQSNDTGKALLNAQGGEISKLKADLTEARLTNKAAGEKYVADMADADKQYQVLAQSSSNALREAAIKYDKLRNDPWVKVALVCKAIWFCIKVWLVICGVLFVLRFVPPIGGVPIGSFAALAFSVLWIPGWFNALADNTYFRGWLPWLKPSTPKATS